VNVALHLALNSTGLNPSELACGDIRNGTSTDLKQMLMLCEKVFAEYTKEKYQNCCSRVKKLQEE
jgi:hypothetical protein